MQAKRAALFAGNPGPPAMRVGTLTFDLERIRRRGVYLKVFHEEKLVVYELADPNPTNAKRFIRSIESHKTIS